MSTAQVTPVNATINFKNGEYVVTPAADGQQVNADEVVRQAIAARQIDRMLDGLRRREIDQHLGSIEIGFSPAVEDRRDVVAGIARDLLDRLSHLPVAVQRDAHYATSTGVSNSAR